MLKNLQRKALKQENYLQWRYKEGGTIEGKYIMGTAGIVTVGVIESIALYTGNDGAYLTACVGAISGLTGLAFGVGIGKSVEKIKDQISKNPDN